MSGGSSSLSLSAEEPAVAQLALPARARDRKLPVRRGTGMALFTLGVADEVRAGSSAAFEGISTPR
jgi:hypothetical protein